MKNIMKKVNYLIYIVLLVLCLSGCSCAKRTEERWNEQYDVGMQYLLEGDYQEAILAFTATIEIDPMRPESYLERAAVYLELGDDASIEAAVADYQKAVELEPTNGQTYVLLAQTYLRQGNYEQAVNTLYEGQEAADEHAGIDAELKKLRLYIDYDDPRYAPFYLNKSAGELLAAGLDVDYGENNYEHYVSVVGLSEAYELGYYDEESWNAYSGAKILDSSLVGWSVESSFIRCRDYPSLLLHVTSDEFGGVSLEWDDSFIVEVLRSEGTELGIIPGISWNMRHEELEDLVGEPLPLYRIDIDTFFDGNIRTRYYTELEIASSGTDRLCILIFWEDFQTSAISEAILYQIEWDDEPRSHDYFWKEVLFTDPFTAMTPITYIRVTEDAEAAYMQKVEEYRTALTLSEDEFYAKYPVENDDASINSYEVRVATTGYHQLFYSIYDIDGNGVDELLISKKRKEQTVRGDSLAAMVWDIIDNGNIIDVYTIVGDRMVKIFPDCIFGYRSMLLVLTDGRLLFVDNSSAFSDEYAILRLHPEEETIEVEEAYLHDEHPMRDPMETFWEYKVETFSKDISIRFTKIYDDYFWEKLYRVLVRSAYDRIPWTELS